MTCKTETCTNRVTQSDGALTVFEETLTESGLATIKEQAAKLPAIAKTNTEYDAVYEFSTRMKRLSVAVRKKEKSIQSDLRADYNTNRDKIKKDLDYVMGVINPLIESTMAAREYIEAWTEAIKENKARTAAAQQRAEFERLEAERQRQAAEQERIRQEEADRQAAELKRQQEEAARQAEAARIERETLARERYEFECEKSRLSYDEAYNEAYPVHIEAVSDASQVYDKKNLIDPMKCAPHIRSIAENASTEPVPIFNIENGESFELKKPDGTITAVDPVTISATIDPDQQSQPEQIDTPAAECGMIDPEDQIKIKSIKNRMRIKINALNLYLENGFESQTITDATYRMIQTITQARDEWVTAVETQA